MVEDILSLLPHRPPFLFVDKIVHLSENDIITEKKVDPDEQFFTGHYPGNPIMPGVLVCEAVFQSAAILVSSLMKSNGEQEDLSKQVPLLTRIRETKFKKIVRPGDLLTMTATINEQMGGAYFFKGSASVDKAVAVRVEFAVTLADREGQ